MATTTTTANATSIKLFQFIRTHYQTNGIYSPQTNPNCSMNTKFLLILLYFILYLMASIAYLLFNAKTFGEFAYSYLLSLTIMLCFGFITVNALKIPKTLQLFEKFEEFIQKSEFFFSKNSISSTQLYFIGKFYSQTYILLII